MNSRTKPPTSAKPVRLRSFLWVYRRAKRLTQQQLAERTGVSRYAISNIETGRSTPSVTLALCIAQALDTSVERIFRLY